MVVYTGVGTYTVCLKKEMAYNILKSLIHGKFENYIRSAFDVVILEGNLKL